jgi:hypothetical protein
VNNGLHKILGRDQMETLLYAKLKQNVRRYSQKRLVVKNIVQTINTELINIYNFCEIFLTNYCVTMYNVNSFPAVEVVVETFIKFNYRFHRIALFNRQSSLLLVKKLYLCLKFICICTTIRYLHKRWPARGFDSFSNLYI